MIFDGVLNVTPFVIGLYNLLNMFRPVTTKLTEHRRRNQESHDPIAAREIPRAS